MSAGPLADRWAAMDRSCPQQPPLPAPPLPPHHAYMPRGRVLTIAGSDPGGGAGIQADLKAILALGGYGMSAITALTAQNTLGVQGVHAAPTSFVELQIDLVVTDLGVDCVKTGMLGTPDVVEAVAAKLQQHGLTQVVVDPVMVAKGGAALLSAEAARAVRERLLPLATVVTPNLPEAAVLLDVPEADIASRGVDGMKWACEALHRLGPKYVLVKGGHLPVTVEGLAPDVLYDGSQFTVLSAPWVDTANTHGTGCTYAAAIATGLAQGQSIGAAVRRAKQYVATAIRTNPGLGHGHGPLNHSHVLRLTTNPGGGLDGGRALHRYFVSDGDEQGLQQALHAGASLVHLHPPAGADTRSLVERTAAALALCRSRAALLLVHDRIDVCLAVGADGVHLGPNSMTCDLARQMLGPEAVIGAEVAGEADLPAAAECGANFVTTRAAEPGAVRALCAAAAVPVVLLPPTPATPELEALFRGGLHSAALALPAPA